MPIYSEKVMDHFTNPRNVGEIENADGIGEVGNPVCGDMMTFYIKVKDNRLEDVKYKTFGCGAAIAVSSMVSELAKGKTLEEAMKLRQDPSPMNCRVYPRINSTVVTRLRGTPQGHRGLPQQTESRRVEKWRRYKKKTPYRKKTDTALSVLQ